MSKLSPAAPAQRRAPARSKRDEIPAEVAALGFTKLDAKAIARMRKAIENLPPPPGIEPYLMPPFRDTRRVILD